MAAYYYKQNNESPTNNPDLISFILSVLSEAVSKVSTNAVTSLSIKFLIGSVASGGTQYAYDEVNLDIKLSPDNSEIQIGDKLYPVDLVVDSAFTTIVTASILSFFANPGVILTLGIAGSVGYVYSKFIDPITEDVIKTLAGKDMVQFIDKNGNYTAGLIFPDGIPGNANDAIHAFIAHPYSAGLNLINGHIQLDTDLGIDDTYAVKSASGFVEIATRLGMTLSGFLSLSSGSYSNDEYYAVSSNGTAYVFYQESYGNPDQSLAVPVMIDGKIENVSVNTVYLGNNLLWGDTVNGMQGTNLILAQAGVYVSGRGYLNDIILGSQYKDIISTGGILWTGDHDTVFAGRGSDTIVNGMNDDTIYGGISGDTYIFNNTYFGNDTIYDGSGKLMFQGMFSNVRLEGIAQEIPYLHGLYFLKAGSDVFLIKDVINSTDIIISKPLDFSNSITIKNFSNGSFNIRLYGSYDNDPKNIALKSGPIYGNPEYGYGDPLADDYDGDGQNDNPNPGNPGNPGNPNYPGQPGAPGLDPNIENARSLMGSATSSITSVRVDPLVFDLDRDGIELTTLANSPTLFDLDGDGFAERTGWVSADDALLVRDLNGSGTIDNINELFGNTTTPGLVKLKTFDSNNDGVINSSDSIFSSLRLWRDLNQNGVSESGELKNLQYYNIKSISLTGISESSVVAGNLIAESATYTLNNGTFGSLSEVYFSLDNLNTVSVGDGGTGGDLPVNMETLLLPLSRGYGILPAWHLAMSNNPSLLSKMQEICSINPGNFRNLENLITQFLYKWADVQSIDHKSRGDFINAQQLTFLEKLIGTSFTQASTGSHNPDGAASVFIQAAWDSVFNVFYDRILIQGIMKDLFAITYDFNSDKIIFRSDVNESIQLAQSASITFASLDSATNYWLAYASIIKNHISEFSQSAAEVNSAIGTLLHDKIGVASKNVDKFVSGTTNNDSISATTGGNLLLSGYEGDDTIIGGDGNDIMLGGSGNDYIQSGIKQVSTNGDEIHGGSGDDTIASNGISTVYGDDGNDYIVGNGTLNGGSGNDILVGGGTLIGGGGNDQMYGENYDTTYLYNIGDGHDEIYDSRYSSNFLPNTLNILQFGEGISFSDLNFSLTGGVSGSNASWSDNTAGFGNNLRITFKNNPDDSIVLISTMINGRYQDFGELHFADGQVINLQTYILPLQPIYGTQYADQISGSAGDDIISGLVGDDILYGRGGNNTLYGNEGNDILYGDSGSSDLGVYRTTSRHNLYGGDGNDTLYGSGSNDTLDGGNGDDALYGGNGSDMLIGGAGNDILNGGGNYDGTSSDTFNGGIGNDIFYGQSTIGNIYIFNRGDGNDIINDANYTIKLGAGISLADLSFTVSGGTNGELLLGNNLKISINNGTSVDSISIMDMFANTSTHTSDKIQFADGSILNLVSSDKYSININGSNSADIINGTKGRDIIYGMGGDDSIVGSVGISNIGDEMRGGDGDDTISGVDGNDVIYGDAGNDYLYGYSGNDTIYGGAGNDHLEGGTGNDVLNGGAGTDTIDGGSGADTTSYSDSTAAVTINLASGVATGGYATGDVLTSIESITGSKYADILTGNNDWNILTGGLGADIIDGGNGIDTASYEDSTALVKVSLVAGAANTGGSAAGDVLTNIENLIGSKYADVLTGNANNNIFTGGLGADIIDGGAGVDTVSYIDSAVAVTASLVAGVKGVGGTAAGDVLTNIENISGSIYNDILTGNASANNLFGDAGNDTITGGLGADYIDGGAGIDTVSYADSTVAVTINFLTHGNLGGAAEGDIVLNVENIIGSSYNDTITGSYADNNIKGGNGNDLIIGGRGADVMDGGAGTDTISYIESEDFVNVSLIAGAVNTGAAAAGDILTNFENLTGSNFDDTLTGNSAVNTINGLNGNDIIIGDLGADIIDGGAGSDTASYIDSAAAVTASLVAGVKGVGGTAAGDALTNIENLTGSIYNDILTGDANANILAGMDGNDTITGGLGADIIDGGAGIDTASYADSTVAVTLNLDTNINLGGTAAGDILTNIENITGSAYNDNIIGNASDNIIIGGLGADVINGGAGNDTASYADSTALVKVSLVAGAANTGGSAAGDVLTNIENLIGSKYADVLTGNANNNIFTGGLGADKIDGGAGIDTASYADSTVAVVASLITGAANTGGSAAGDVLTNIENLLGSKFNDTLIGNALANTLTGGLGADTLTGGAGNDIFHYDSISDSKNGSYDTVTDFISGQDKIDISMLGTFGINDFADLTIGYSSATNQTVITANDNSNPANTDIFELHMAGNINLSNADFIFG